MPHQPSEIDIQCVDGDHGVGAELLDQDAGASRASGLPSSSSAMRERPAVRQRLPRHRADHLRHRRAPRPSSLPQHPGQLAGHQARVVVAGVGKGAARGGHRVEGKLRVHAVRLSLLPRAMTAPSGATIIDPPAKQSGPSTPTRFARTT